MTELRYRQPEKGFLALSPEEACPAEAARAVVIPFGLEATVCYGKGTSLGPEAIIEASEQIDYFDEEFWLEAYREFGVATLETPAIPADIDAALDQLAQLNEAVLAADMFPLTLGGEHSLTGGAIRPFAKRWPNLAVLHFDAHADLRDSYLGSPNSHASAMRRVLDHPGVTVVSVGIRNFCVEEVAFYEANRDRVTIHMARDKARWRIEDIIAPLKGRPLYISFDVDGLDTSIMPAPGTPEPGGLLYYEACDILRAACEAGTPMGADLVELAPIAGQNAWDVTAARLAYKLLSYAFLTKRQA
ncbi:MAG: agmatinase [Alphaproteobacteria bacterium]